MTPVVAANATDEQLMRRVQSDDPDAFAQLFDRHAGRALRVAGFICRDRGHAEDAVQEAFLAMWRCRADFRPQTGSFQAWSMKVVRHRAVDSVRRATAARRPQQAVGVDAEAESQAPEQTSPEAQAIRRSEGEAVRASLSLLPEDQAEVIALAYFGELTHTEIATQLELPAGTVKGRMRLWLKKLRRDLEGAR